MDIALPETLDGILPFAAAAVTLAVGVFALFMPRGMLRSFRLGTHPLHPEAIAQVRGTIGGFYFGTGLIALMLFDQPTAQIMLGAAWAFAAFGRLVSILSDDGATIANWSMLLVEVVVAALPLSVAFGFVTG